MPERTEPIRVFLVDDQDLVRTGFRLVLELSPDIVVVGEADCGTDAIDALDSGLAVDVVCMDVRMPGMDGIETTRALLAAGLGIRVLILTTFDADEYVYDALAAGASGFLLKDCGATELAAGIRTVHSGDAVLAPRATSRLVERFRPQLAQTSADSRRAQLKKVLSAREIDILTCVGEGLSNQEITEKLFLAETTVKSHIGHLFTKLGARDRIGLVIVAYDTGLAKPRL